MVARVSLDLGYQVVLVLGDDRLLAALAVDGERHLKSQS